MAVLHCLPPLPFILNYEKGARTGDDDRIVATLEYQDRVGEIAFMGSSSSLGKFLKRRNALFSHWRASTQALLLKHQLLIKTAS